MKDSDWSHPDTSIYSRLLIKSIDAHFDVKLSYVHDVLARVSGGVENLNRYVEELVLDPVLSDIDGLEGFGRASAVHEYFTEEVDMAAYAIVTDMRSVSRKPSIETRVVLSLFAVRAPGSVMGVAKWYKDGITLDAIAVGRLIAAGVDPKLIPRALEHGIDSSLMSELR